MSTTREMHSWGRLQGATSAVDSPAWRDRITIPPGPALAYGLGRSYGDSCLLSGGTMIETRFLDRLISFDRKSGLLRAEAGISLDAILRFCVPLGWFLPTTPGTRQVTLGGAIANDVHGKNHHRAGCFGNHVPRLELMRSDGSCKAHSVGDPLHAATIGGLGLTGIITWAELQLVPIRSADLDVELVRFKGLEEFLTLSRESEERWEHTVAWIDCLASGSSLGSGIFIRGNWAESGELKAHQPPGASVPVDFPEFALNRFSIATFNTLYYRRFLGKRKQLQQHYSPFFHPLDSVQGWSRIYGKKGFYEYQCVIPFEAGAEAMNDLLSRIARSGQGSFLAVLKTFGDKVSPGILSFPSPGITLALDFANRGTETLALFEDLNAIVRSARGRFYPAKDARMSRGDFTHSYPRLGEFHPFIDPAFSSDFWETDAIMNESRYHVAVFGATSAIATEILRSIVAERSAFILLIGRDAAKLETLAADLQTRGADCEILAIKLLDPEIDWNHHLGTRVWDLFLLAHGSLPDQQATLSSGVAIAREICVNFTSHAVIGAACANLLDRQERGTLAVIGSVAGDRGRQSNYLYGSAKAGIDTFMAGLRHRFSAKGKIHTVLLKPGMTDTPMTADIQKGPLFSPADKVGRLGWRAIRKGKAVAYLPGWWSLVMLIIRSVPGFIFHKTKL